MSQKQHLFQLIKSLTISEKGYFKKYYTKYGENQAYLQLFDAIDGQETYDEESLKKRFKDKGFVKQFSVAKNYLIKNVMRGLRAYYSESSKDIQLHELLIDIELLYKRRLISQCRKVIKRAKKIALEAELFNKYSEIALWELRLYILEPFSDRAAKQVEAIQAFAEEGSEKDKNLVGYRHLAYHVFKRSMKEGTSRKQEDMKAFVDMYAKNDLLKDTNQAISITALGGYHNLWSKLYEIQYDYQSSYEASLAFVKLIQGNPSIFEDYVSAIVIPAHYNLLVTCAYLNKKESFFENLDYLKRVPDIYKQSDKVIRRILDFYCTNIELLYYVQNAYFKEAIDVIPKAAELVADKSNNSLGFLFIKIEMCYTIAYAYFGVEDYDKSIDWINKIIQEERIELREDLLCYAHLLSLINHFELNNYKYISYKLRTTHNYISKMRKSYNFERTALKFIKKMLRVKDKTEMKNTIQAYKGKFEEISKDPFEQEAFKNFDITSWLDSKLTGTEFAKIAALKREKEK
ncbi:MAG: hypothetical protein GY810_10360 [Aureispira sp.]|nr:hypothetical protein [Aureispira sp.]